MKELFIKQLKTNQPVSPGEAGNLLEKQTVSNPVNIVNWKTFDYQPKVSFRIGHVQNKIWLKYDVREKHILARETQTNGDVYKDSCVEFFISLDGKNYYNFEFSCIGTIHLAHGAGRENRRFVDPQLIEKINIESSLGNQPFEEKTGDFEWDIVIQIPLECFAFDDLHSLSGIKASANFYKCGEDTSLPHYITWNPIETKSPDYHRPEYFGKVFFE
jgi:hypothetical protein